MNKTPKNNHHASLPTKTASVSRRTVARRPSAAPLTVPMTSERVREIARQEVLAHTVERHIKEHSALEVQPLWIKVPCRYRLPLLLLQNHKPNSIRHYLFFRVLQRACPGIPDNVQFHVCIAVRRDGMYARITVER